MIAIQKITSLGFSLHDGMHRPYDSLLDHQKRTAVRRVPSLLEYLSYVLQFPTLMSGPMITFHDYIEFVEGTAFTKHIPTEQIEKGHKPSPTVCFWFACTSFEHIDHDRLILIVYFFQDGGFRKARHCVVFRFLCRPSRSAVSGRIVTRCKVCRSMFTDHCNSLHDHFDDLCSI